MWVELKVLNDYDGARFAIQKLKTIEINIKAEKLKSREMMDG